MYRLIFLSGPNRGKRLAIQKGLVMIGRDPKCHIALTDRGISHQHAVIEQHHDDFHIHDLSSEEGILVNDRQCRESKLMHGDTIQIGRTKILFQLIRRPEALEDRRVTHSQGVALAAVIGTVLVQLAFVVGFSLWRRNIVSLEEKVSATATIGTISTLSTVSNTFIKKKVPLQTEKKAHLEAIVPTRPLETNVTQNIETQRADLKESRRQVSEHTKPETPVARATNATSFTPAFVEEKPLKEVDALTAKAQQMLQVALLEITNHVAEAEKQLEQIQLMAPDFLPAYIELARLCEKRGDIAKAGEQWREVLHRSSGTPLYEQAAAERIRLSRLEIIRQTEKTRSSVTRQQPANRLEQRVKIVSAELHRFPENEEFEEMRLLRITLKPRAGERNMDLSKIRVSVFFFDEDTSTQRVHPTRVTAPKDALQLDGDWNTNGQQTVTAAYVVPKYFRTDEWKKFNQKCTYYGYLAKVYYGEQMQDEDARPKVLLQKADQFQPPWLRSTTPVRQKP